jgi:hypothetical protein
MVSRTSRLSDVEDLVIGGVTCGKVDLPIGRQLIVGARGRIFRDRSWLSILASRNIFR